MTGCMPDDEYYPMSRLIDDVVTAVKSDSALPPDPIGQSALAASVGAAANERALPVGGAPALQQSTSGRTYHLDENEFHITAISLRLTGDDAMVIPATNSGKPGALTEYFPGPLGLDGRFRLTAPNRFGIAAARGRWVGDNTLTIERRTLGRSATQRWLLTFDGNNVVMHGHAD